ncbi:MAG TPA: MbnH family di-heme enzyme [Kofleriaceae bacterium]|jgi:cytochrome c peroxidase|nr:MbnH family di-heme enzyme [Kofleriaceae bacterium]
MWNTPASFPVPRVPDGNPMSAAKVELGCHLFYDTRLSGNQTQSCASCHVQAHAFAGPDATELGSTGESGRRNAMSLANVAWNSVQTWANPELVELEQQALVPMFGEAPVELGLAGMEQTLIGRIRAEPAHASRFAEAFPALADPVTIDTIVQALGSFDRAIISDRSPYDRFVAGDEGALSDAAKRGLELFFSEKLECHHCHGGFNLTASYRSMDTAPEGFVHYFNNGLYNVDGAGGYPATDRGLLDISGETKDMGKFRAPTLRNVAVTAPYMHDGSVATLDDVITMYARGGRLVADGPNAGDGAASPIKNVLINGFALDAGQRADLAAFLDSLTDQALLTDPALSNPWD